MMISEDFRSLPPLIYNHVNRHGNFDFNIVETLISSKRSDQFTLIPVLDKLEENLDKKFFIIVDDAGYESQENYTFIEQNNQTSFLKTPNYETMKKSSFKRDISKRENMRYDEELNEYTCYNNRKLKPVVNKKLQVSKAFVKKDSNLFGI